jgi:hypothetical protein
MPVAASMMGVDWIGIGLRRAVVAHLATYYVQYY